MSLLNQLFVAGFFLGYALRRKFPSRQFFLRGTKGFLWADGSVPLFHTTGHHPCNKDLPQQLPHNNRIAYGELVGQR